jgi:hypothetical protein
MSSPLQAFATLGREMHSGTLTDSAFTQTHTLSGGMRGELTMSRVRFDRVLDLTRSVYMSFSFGSYGTAQGLSGRVADRLYSSFESGTIRRGSRDLVLIGRDASTGALTLTNADRSGLHSRYVQNLATRLLTAPQISGELLKALGGQIQSYFQTASAISTQRTALDAAPNMSDADRTLARRELGRAWGALINMDYSGASRYVQGVASFIEFNNSRHAARSKWTEETAGERNTLATLDADIRTAENAVALAQGVVNRTAADSTQGRTAVDDLRRAEEALGAARIARAKAGGRISVLSDLRSEEAASIAVAERAITDRGITGARAEMGAFTALWGITSFIRNNMRERTVTNPDGTKTISWSVSLYDESGNETFIDLWTARTNISTVEYRVRGEDSVTTRRVWVSEHDGMARSGHYEDRTTTTATYTTQSVTSITGINAPSSSDVRFLLAIPTDMNSFASRFGVTAADLREPMRGGQTNSRVLRRNEDGSYSGLATTSRYTFARSLAAYFEGMRAMGSADRATRESAASLFTESRVFNTVTSANLSYERIMFIRIDNNPETTDDDTLYNAVHGPEGLTARSPLYGPFQEGEPQVQYGYHHQAFGDTIAIRNMAFGELMAGGEQHWSNAASLFGIVANEFQQQLGLVTREVGVNGVINNLTSTLRNPTTLGARILTSGRSDLGPIPRGNTSVSTGD